MEHTSFCHCFNFGVSSFRVGIPRREIEKLYPATVQYNGSVKWDFPIIMQSHCPLNLTYFPWDEQNCEFIFNSWAYDTHALDLYNLTASGGLGNAAPDGEWKMKNFTVKRVVKNFPDPFAYVTYTLKLERKPLYYIVNLVLPCLFITFCGTLVFLLPPDSGEKVSMSVTMLLSSTVFLLVVADIMPTQSDVIPMIGK